MPNLDVRGDIIMGKRYLGEPLEWLRDTCSGGETQGLVFYVSITKPNLVREQQHQRLLQGGIAIPGGRGSTSFVCQILKRNTTEPYYYYRNREVITDEDDKNEEYAIDLKYSASEVFDELAPALVVDRIAPGEDGTGEDRVYGSAVSDRVVSRGL